MDLGDHLYHFSDEKKVVIRSLHVENSIFALLFCQKKNANGMVYQFTKKNIFPPLPSEHLRLERW